MEQNFDNSTCSKDLNKTIKISLSHIFIINFTLYYIGNGK